MHMATWGLHKRNGRNLQLVSCARPPYLRHSFQICFTIIWKDKAEDNFPSLLPNYDRLNPPGSYIRNLTILEANMSY